MNSTVLLHAVEGEKSVTYLYEVIIYLEGDSYYMRWGRPLLKLNFSNSTISEVALYDPGMIVRDKQGSEYKLTGTATGQLLGCIDKDGKTWFIDYTELDYVTLPDGSCCHDWETHALFTSTYRKCKRCGAIEK